MDIKKLLFLVETGTERSETRTGELLPKIVVKDPVIHNSWTHGRYTSYQICIKTDHPAFRLRLSSVRRRYNEIKWLYSVLKANHRYVSLPALPPKHVLAERYDSKFISTRMKEIEVFLNKLMVTDTILSDAAFHIFLQTDLTTEEIDDYFDGKLSEDTLESAWKNAGHLHTSSYVVSTNSIPYEPQEIKMNEEDEELSNRSTPSSGDSDSITSSSQSNEGASGAGSKHTNSPTANQKSRTKGQKVHFKVEEDGRTGLALDTAQSDTPQREGVI